MSGVTTLVDASPSFVPGTFDGQDVRLAALGNVRPGLFASGDFAVSQRAAGANMSVDIAAGRAYVEPGDTSQQGVYLPWMGSTYNTSSNGGYVWTAADATNPRIDLVCLEVRDTDFGGSYTGFKFRVIDGTPNASASHQLATTYWPAIPSGCVPIAAVRVPAAATTLTTANITNLNPIGGNRNSYSYVATAETTTSATYARLATPDFLCFYLPHANCKVRVYSEGQWKVNVASGVQLLSWYLNDVSLKTRNTTNGAPSVQATSTGALTLGTFHSRFYSADYGGSTIVYGVAGATADVSDVTNGIVSSNSAGTAAPKAIEITQLAAGWYVLEQRYQTSANTLTVANRRMWAEVAV